MWKTIVHFPELYAGPTSIRNTTVHHTGAQGVAEPCGRKVNIFNEKKFNINPYTNFIIYITIMIYSLRYRQNSYFINNKSINIFRNLFNIEIFFKKK